MEPKDDPIILAMRDVAKSITALRKEHEERFVELEDARDDMRGELEKAHDELGEIRPHAERYMALVERVRDHDRGIITFEELMQEVGRG